MLFGPRQQKDLHRNNHVQISEMEGIPGFGATQGHNGSCILQDDANLVQLMQRFGRTDLGAEDLDDSDLEKFLNGEHFILLRLIHLSTQPCCRVST